jgi:hypothetical protein
MFLTTVERCGFPSDVLVEAAKMLLPLFHGSSWASEWAGEQVAPWAVGLPLPLRPPMGSRAQMPSAVAWALLEEARAGALLLCLVPDAHAQIGVGHHVVCPPAVVQREAAAGGRPHELTPGPLGLWLSSGVRLNMLLYPSRRGTPRQGWL